MVGHSRCALVHLPTSPVTGACGIHRPRLALSIWPFTEGSFLIADGAEICGALVSCRDHWSRDRLLYPTLRRRMAYYRTSSHSRGYFAYSAELVGVSLILPALGS